MIAMLVLAAVERPDNSILLFLAANIITGLIAWGSLSMRVKTITERLSNMPLTSEVLLSIEKLKNELTVQRATELKEAVAELKKDLTEKFDARISGRSRASDDAPDNLRADIRQLIALISTKMTVADVVPLDDTARRSLR